MNKYFKNISFFVLVLILFFSVGAVCATNDNINDSVSPQIGRGKFLM